MCQIRWHINMAVCSTRNAIFFCFQTSRFLFTGRQVISLDQSRWGEERGLWCTQLSWCFLINLDPIYKQGKAIQKQVWGSDRNVMKSKGSILRTVSHSAFWCPFVEGLAASESLALCERWSLSKPAKQQKHSMYTGFKDMAEACRKQGKQWCKQNFLLPTKN